MESDLILPLNQIRQQDIGLVGGKAANLGELIHADFPVPRGFCITTTAFDRFLDASGCADSIYATLRDLDSDDSQLIAGKSDWIRQQLDAVVVPTEISAAILAMLSEYDPQITFAVRSSATAEDLPDVSFAGQQDTYLNIRESLIDSVRSCWHSLFTARAISYRIEHGFDHREVKLAVIVQEMIDAEISGILFTADPQTGNRDHLTIAASYGLGEALVSGVVDADFYRVDKTTGLIIDRQLGDKNISITSTESEGTIQQETELADRKSNSLSDKHIKGLAAKGIEIENYFTSPQDIEWCMADEKIYIVQSRPITTLYPLPEPAPVDEHVHLYLCFNHLQVMTDPISPMGQSVLRTMVPVGADVAGTRESSILVSAGGRLYLDATAPLVGLKRVRKAAPLGLRFADLLMASAVDQALQRPEFALRPNRQLIWQIVPVFLRRLLPIWSGVAVALFFKTPEGTGPRLNAFIAQYSQQVKKSVSRVTNDLHKVELLESTIADNLIPVVKNIVPNIAAGLISFFWLTRLVAKLELDDDLQALTRGLEGNITVELDLAVGDLTDLALQHPQVIKLLQEKQYSSVSDLFRLLAVLPESQQFASALERFLDDYGCRTQAEIDIATPRWSEDPHLLMNVILGNTEGKDTGSHRHDFAKLKEDAARAADHLLRELGKQPFGKFKRALAGRLIRNYRYLFAMREHPKFCLIRGFGQIKKELLQIANHLVERRILTGETDIFYLSLPELKRLLKGAAGEEFTTLIQQRKTDLKRQRKLYPPKVMTSRGEVLHGKYLRENLPEGAIPGTPVSAGRIEGFARVITDPSREILNRGEILIAPFTDPGWTPLFINAAALVMEVGGMMTHGSVVAREYGIPAVVNIPQATTLIKTGQRILVDGDQGFIQVKEDD